MTTRGVRLQRRGEFDVFTAEQGEVPRRVTVQFKPVADGLQHDHPPALVFTDGSVALFVAQFDCFPMDSMAEVRALPADLNNHPVPAVKTRYVFRDVAGPVLLGGKRSTSGETTEKDTYVLFGGTSPVETPDMIGIFDPQLPPWIQESLTDGVPLLIGRYAQELGALRNLKPTIMVSWEGPTPGLMSREGGTLRGLVAMRYSGAGLLVETLTSGMSACGSSPTRRRISGSARPWATNTRATPGSPRAAPSCWRSAPWRRSIRTTIRAFR